MSMEILQIDYKKIKMLMEKYLSDKQFLNISFDENHTYEILKMPKSENELISKLKQTILNSKYDIEHTAQNGETSLIIFKSDDGKFIHPIKTIPVQEDNYSNNKIECNWMCETISKHFLELQKLVPEPFMLTFESEYQQLNGRLSQWHVLEIRWPHVLFADF